MPSTFQKDLSNVENMKIDIDGILEELVADEDTLVADYADAVIAMLQKYYFKGRSF